MGKALLNCRKECVIKADKSQIKFYFSCQDLHWTLFLSKGRFSSQVSDTIPIHYSRQFWARSQTGFTKGTDLWLPLKSVSIPEFRSLGVKLCSSEPSFSKNHWKKKKKKKSKYSNCNLWISKHFTKVSGLTPFLSQWEYRGILWDALPADGTAADRAFVLEQKQSQGLKSAGTPSTWGGVWFQSLSAAILRWWRSGYLSKEITMAD